MPWRGIRTTLVAVVMAATFAASCSFGTPDEDQFLGRWRVESFNDSPVVVGANTAEWPTVEFARGHDGYTVSGSLGCNTFGAGYSIDGDELVLSDGASTAMGCAFDGAEGPGGEASAMRAEIEISEVLFSPPVGVEFDGDDRATMIVRSAGGEMILERVGGGVDGGGETATDPPVGPLDCGDRDKVEEHLVASGLSQADAARAADPAVVRTDNNLHTTFGFDSDDRMIVEVQNTDSGPGDHLVYTCTDG